MSIFPSLNNKKYLCRQTNTKNSPQPQNGLYVCSIMNKYCCLRLFNKMCRHCKANDDYILSMLKTQLANAQCIVFCFILHTKPSS